MVCAHQRMAFPFSEVRVHRVCLVPAEKNGAAWCSSSGVEVWTDDEGHHLSRAEAILGVRFTLDRLEFRVRGGGFLFIQKTICLRPRMHEERPDLADGGP